MLEEISELCLTQEDGASPNSAKVQMQAANAARSFQRSLPAGRRAQPSLPRPPEEGERQRKTTPSPKTQGNARRLRREWEATPRTGHRRQIGGGRVRS